jgi:hypothetical protein
LKACVLATEARGEIGRAHSRSLGDGLEDGGRPASVRAHAVEASEPEPELGEVVVGEGDVRGEDCARIGAVRGTEPDAIGRKLPRSRQPGQQLDPRREPGSLGIRVGDAVGVHYVHRVDHDAPGRRSIRVAGDDLRAFPPPERQCDRATGNRIGEPSLDQHCRNPYRLPRRH